MRLLGEEYYIAQQYPDALEYFEGIEDLGDQAEARIGLAQAQIGLEMFDAARETLEAGMEQYPTDGRFPFWLGRVYEAEAEFDLSRQYYRQAMQIEPANVRPLVALAQLAERENIPAGGARPAGASRREQRVRRRHGKRSGRNVPAPQRDEPRGNSVPPLT